jgi:hypothetical protein
MQAIYRGAWVQGQYRPVRAGVSCAAVRCGVHVLSTHRDMVADEHSGCISIVMQAIYRGAWVQGQYRPVRFGVSCAAARCGMHVLSTHRGLAFGLYLNRDAGNLSGGVGVRPVSSGLACTCRRLLCEHSGCISIVM